MAHLPQRAIIDSYGDGGFRFAGMSHRGSLLAVPSGMHGWAPTSLQSLSPRDFEQVLAERANIDVLLIGTGQDMARPTAAVRAALAGQDMQVDVMSTGAAIRTYNIMFAENRRVAAALIAVDKPHG
jgi:uncharacterized protein